MDNPNKISSFTSCVFVSSIVDSSQERSSDQLREHPLCKRHACLQETNKRKEYCYVREENKAIILRGVEAEQKEGLQAMLAIYDPACSFPDLAFYGLPPTLEGFKQFLSSATAAFSDISDTVEVIVAEGDRVMVWGT